MILIDKSSTGKLQDIRLHDAKITEIYCNYEEHVVRLPISFSCKDGKTIKGSLILEGVLYADISFYEPWGAGTYINDVEICDYKEITNKLEGFECDKVHFLLSILLNSGDKINTVISKLIYSEN